MRKMIRTGLSLVVLGVVVAGIAALAAAKESASPIKPFAIAFKGAGSLNCIHLLAPAWGVSGK